MTHWSQDECWEVGLRQQVRQSLRKEGKGADKDGVRDLVTSDSDKSERLCTGRARSNGDVTRLTPRQAPPPQVGERQP